MILYFNMKPRLELNQFAENPFNFGLSDNFRMVIWRPSLLSIKPICSDWFPFIVWFVFHKLGVFKSADYCIYLLYLGNNVVHRSCVFPAFFRFPFMSRGDVQFGDIWTSPEFRSQGLSKYILSIILRDFRDRSVWYLCDSKNISSVALAHGVGFKCKAIGVRSSRFGIHALGKYIITRTLN
jgi:GNAT superfamily N-acetyltransferase